jgi:hypothetical protein
LVFLPLRSVHSSRSSPSKRMIASLGALPVPACAGRLVCVGFCYVEFLYPGVSEHYVVAFALEFEAAGDVGDSFATVVASVDAGVGTAPDLLDPLVGVGFDSVEVHCHECLLG